LTDILHRYSIPRPPESGEYIFIFFGTAVVMALEYPCIMRIVNYFSVY
jgi:hypothetical protein